MLNPNSKALNLLESQKPDILDCEKLEMTLGYLRIEAIEALKLETRQVHKPCPPPATYDSENLTTLQAGTLALEHHETKERGRKEARNKT